MLYFPTDQRFDVAMVSIDRNPAAVRPPLLPLLEKKKKRKGGREAGEAPEEHHDG